MKFPYAILSLGLSVFLSGCTPKTDSKIPIAVEAPKSKRVILYCSVDQVFSKPIIEQLKTQTGLDIGVVYDTESTKTAGLATKIRSERANPRADVFWSSALLQTLLLGEEDLLDNYQSPQAADLPSQFRGKNWAGVGVRGRILIHTSRWSYRVQPQVQDSIGSAWEEMPSFLNLGISNPQFGTASDWATAFATRRGDAATLNWFGKLKKNRARILPGNGDVARQVAADVLSYGVTDSDDFLAQRARKKALPLFFTQKDNVLVPGSVALLKNAPHAENARKLLDAIVSKENERALIQTMPGVFSLRRLKEKSNWQSGGVDFSFLQNAPADDYAQWPATWKKLREPLARVLAP